VQYVVQPQVFAGPLHRDQVERRLNDADDRLIATGGQADRAAIPLRDVVAPPAESDPLLDGANRGGQRLSSPRLLLENEEGQALRGLRSDTGQARELLDEVLERTW
jgi:hypothetical protein